MATMPTGRPSTRASAVTMPDAEPAAQLEHRARVGQRVDDGAHVVDPQPVLGHDVAQRGAGRRTSQSSIAALEVRQVLLGHGDRLGLVGHGDVDDAVGDLHVDRADLLGRVHAEPAALDHRRAAHADVRVARWR